MYCNLNKLKFYIIIIFFFLVNIFIGKLVYSNETVDVLCGPKSLLTICEKFGITTSLNKICNLVDYSEQNGTTLLGLYNAANKLGISAVPVKIDKDQLCRVTSPSIAFVDGNHFLVVHGCTWRKVKVQEPPGKPYYVSKKDFLKRWNGEALVFSEKLKKQMASQIAQAMKPPEGAHIQFYETEYNFGVVNESDKLSYKFKFTNIGTDTLNVSARSTCGCTVAVLSGENIPPGDSGEIVVVYDTTGRKGFTTQSVDVRTNNPEKRWVRLTLSATVRTSTKVVPDRLWLDEVTIGEEVSRELLVVDPGEKTLIVERVEIPEGITAEILPIREETTGFRAVPVKLSIMSGTKPGDFEKKIIIHTNDLKRRAIVVPISGIVLGDLKAFPPSIFFGDVKQDIKVIREITLSPTNDKRLEIYKATSLSPYISTEVKTIEGGSKYKLVATLNSPGTDMTIRDNIPIYINGNKDPAIEIPLYARVVGSQK